MRVAIIGGGIAGLTAAYRLSKRGDEVVVYEANPELGGLASGFKHESWSWPLERFYHHLFESDSFIRGLCDEIGFADHLFFQKPMTTQWWNGGIYPLDSPTAVLAFPGLPVTDRIRFGMGIAKLKFFNNNWQDLETQTAAQWCPRVLGKKSYELLLQPLLEGKFGEDYPNVNMAWLWSRFKARTPKLGYFKGGFQTFNDALAKSVTDAGGQVRLASPVKKLSQSEGKWLVSTTDGEAEAFDWVISTTSPALMSQLAEELPDDYLGKIKNLRSLGAVVMTIALKQPLTESAYWINVPKSVFPYLAVVEHTNFIPKENYGGMHIVYCGDYVPVDHNYFSMTKEQLLEKFLPSLKRINQNFDSGWVIDAWLHREKYAQPIVGISHSHNIPPLQTPLKGLIWASMSHVYPWDRGTNFAVELGEKAAAQITV